MSEASNGRGLIIAALISSAAIIAAAVLVSNALDRTTEQVALAAAALAEGPRAPRPRARPIVRAGRDARTRDRTYEVAVGKAPVLGDEDAAITIVEWSEFQCPFCNRAAPTLAQIRDEYGSKVRLVFKHLPLSMHAQAPGAHAAAEAAHRQGKFWEMHDKIFASQRDLAPATFERYAAELGLDVDRFKRDVASADVKKRIDEDMDQAQQLGVTGTPAFFINGRFLSGAQPFSNFKRVIDSALEKES